MQLLALRIVPTGWYYQNQLVYNRVMDSIPFNNYNEATRIIQPVSQSASVERIDTLARDKSPYARFARNLLATIGIPNYTRAVLTAAHNQTLLNEALIACALERYRLAHGDFPEKLDALAPQFLADIPHDLIGGRPLKYQRTQHEKFLLYSVGWNEKDDGGVTARTKGGSEDREQGDWVWGTTIK